MNVLTLLPARLLLALCGGALLWLSFPDHDVAAAAVAGVALI